MIRICTFLLFLLVTLPAEAQRGEQFAWPYAARHAPRIGGSYDIGRDRVRLDIGSSLPLYDITDRGVVGVDFFTWSRLRSETNFKFPVEAIDYYFGAWGGWDFGSVDGLRLSGVLRLAHISTHLVDGEPRFARAGFEPFVYSREFLDLQFIGEWRGEVEPESGYVRYSGGLRWLFHTIPDTIGRIRPFTAIESAWSPSGTLPVTLRSGIEFGLNYETGTTLELSARAGLKFAGTDENGAMIEAGYVRGNSVFGQYFYREESYFWIGFGFGR